MNKFTLITILILCSQLLACQSTKIAYQEKRPLVSDHQLLVSLLNRPIPQDQQLMMAFTRQFDQQYSAFDLNMPSVAPVFITGEKRAASETRPIFQFSHLVNQDKNAIFINGPI
ncbi:hypothetical protein [Thalassotalea fusca]